MLNFDVTPEEKLQDAYQGNYERLVVNHFSAGLRDNIKRVVWGVPNPPDSIDRALAGANAVEAEDDKRRNERTVAAIVEDAPAGAEAPPLQPDPIPLDPGTAVAEPTPSGSTISSGSVNVSLLQEVKSEIDRVLAVTGNRKARGGGTSAQRNSVQTPSLYKSKAALTR